MEIRHQRKYKTDLVCECRMWNTDWGNDVVTKKIKDDLKLDVEFLVGDDTKLNTFFAGGDMPILLPF